jgi:S1-C subfamily serine protease
VHVRADVQPWDPTLARWLTRFGPLPRRAASPPRATSGAGVVLAPGWVATTLHTVAGAREITVQDDAGATLPATLATSDAAHDLAWLEVPGLRAPAAPLRDAPRVGDVAISLGFPTDQGLLASAGLVSGWVQRAVGGAAAQPWLVTDALVRVGHSGGPLIDERGAVLGMIVGGYAEGSHAEGYGLALPAARLRPPVGLAAAPPARPPASGLEVTSAPDLTWQGCTFGPGAGGVTVLGVDARRAAFGLAPGDVVTALGATPTPDVGALRAALEALPAPGALATLSGGRGAWWPR